MMKKLCIAYVTKTNTTKEIAEEIAKIAREKDWDVKVLPVSAIASLEEFDAILIGAPINGMQWLPEAVEFVEKNQAALKTISTSYFLVSYLMNSGAKMWKKTIDKSLNKVKAIVQPVKIGKFDGRIEDEFPGFARLLFGVKKGTPLDLRDWDGIRAWANEYIEELEAGSRKPE
jgi:menaquinone-dependent protoporphyrinogen oxidase